MQKENKVSAVVKTYDAGALSHGVWPHLANGGFSFVTSIMHTAAY